MVFLKKHYYSSCVKRLQAQDPSSLEKLSEQKALEQFNKKREIPLYRSLLIKSSTQPKPETIAQFKQDVPIVNKNIFFEPKSDCLESILSGIASQDSQSILLSSGTSGRFSFGISSHKQSSRNAIFLDVLFHHYFQILDIKTLVINCLPSAVKLPFLSATTLEIGPRHDALAFALKNLSPHFGQTVILGDNYFIKNALEDAAVKEKIELPKLNIHLILGGIYLPENLRTYLSGLLQSDFQKNKSMIYSSMGISEFGLNVFFEDKRSVFLRQLLQQDPSLKEKICGNNFPFAPLILNHFPQFYYIEEVKGEIVITDLKDSPIPLIRYNTQDQGKIISYEDFHRLTSGQLPKDLHPIIRSSVVLMYGRDKALIHNGRAVYSQQILDILLSKPPIASHITGYIRLNTQNGQLSLEVQLKPGVHPDDIKSQMERTLYDQPGFEARLALHPYEAFPYGRDLDWAGKFKFI